MFAYVCMCGGYVTVNETVCTCVYRCVCMYVHICEGQRSTLDVILDHSLPCILEQSLTPGLTNLVHDHTSFYVGHGDLNPVLHACEAGTLQTEPACHDTLKMPSAH